MTVSQLKTRLAELLEIEKKEADDILWALQELCVEVVKKGDSVTIPGVGKLSCAVRAARVGRNPRTGEAVKVPAKVAVKFGLTKSLKESAPKLTSKSGKRLLEEAEAKQAAAAKRKRKKEKEEAKDGSSKKKKKSSERTSTKKSSKKSKSSKRV